MDQKKNRVRSSLNSPSSPLARPSSSQDIGIAGRLDDRDSMASCPSPSRIRSEQPRRMSMRNQCLDGAVRGAERAVEEFMDRRGTRSSAAASLLKLLAPAIQNMSEVLQKIPKEGVERDEKIGSLYSEVESNMSSITSMFSMAADMAVEKRHEEEHCSSEGEDKQENIQSDAY